MKKERLATLSKQQLCEHSIITTYRKSIWRPFVAAITDYNLIEDGDKIAVCLSGGKDSMLLAKCMQELHCHGKQNFELKFLVMDPGYSPENMAKIEENARVLGVPIVVKSSRIFDFVAQVKQGSPCYLCARMRRGNLYAFAKELGCNKIALGHHFNDVIETTLLSVLYNGKFKTMLPKLKSKNFAGMQLIRPLYLVKEQDIINWKNYNNLQFLNCSCRFTESCPTNPDDDQTSKRRQMKWLVKKLKEINPEFDNQIFTSLHQVDVKTVLSTLENGQEISFLSRLNESENDNEES